MPATPPPGFVFNGGFEDGESAWSLRGDADIVADCGVLMGSSCASVNDGGGLSQLVGGLKPNTSYTLVAFARTPDFGLSLLSVKDFGGEEPVSVLIGAAEYQEFRLLFRTGPEATQALVDFTALNKLGQLDDVSIVEGMLPPAPTPSSTPEPLPDEGPSPSPTPGGSPIPYPGTTPVLTPSH